MTTETTFTSDTDAAAEGKQVALDVRSLSKTYGSGAEAHRAIDEVSFTVQQGEIVCVVGPSGCGKTTLLKSIAGLMPPTSGETLVNGVAVTTPPKDLAVVFQDYSRSLFPWMSVTHNIALPLQGRGLSRRAIKERTRESLSAVGLDDVAAQKHPFQLSGGMQQRVAIARALAYQPRVLLMDEPFASVDAQTRAELEDLVRTTRDRFGVSVLFITHDIDESVYLAERVVILGPSPTFVREVLPIDLPAERDQISTKELPEFARLRGHVYRAIRRETGPGAVAEGGR
jgi:NitT/TauT family transport system ATP-binding protein